MSSISDAKRLIAAHSLDGLQVLGAGVSRPCAQARYDRAAEVALSDPEAQFTPEERELIASFIGGEQEQATTQDTFIRNLNVDLYRQARILAVEQGVPVAEIVNAALAEYLGRYSSRAIGQQGG